MHGHHWPDAHHALLSKLKGDGLSASLIADRLNAEFKTDYTRNAVIGRSHRQGLAHTVRYKAPAIRKERQPKYARVRLPSGELMPLAPEHVESPQPYEFLGITFAQINDSHCRYPRGNPVVYCGQRKMGGSSYCAACHALCYDGRRRAA